MVHLARKLAVRAQQLRPSPAAILFDLDGTLVDTMSAFADIAADVMSCHYGLMPKNARRLYLQTSGIPFCQQLEVIFGASETNGVASAEFERRKHAVADCATMDRATAIALATLKSRGFALAVSSNGMQDHVDTFAARSGGLFDLALGFGGGLSKGEPHVAEACARLGLGRENLLFVGDSIRDGELAGQSGVRFVARAGTFSPAQFDARFPGVFVLDHIADLPALVA
jgi:phosphoglycolate phosphatase-like HAD superfamily hydrolase